MIQRIQITNLGPFATFDALLPAVALVQGGNGAGKTGLLDCAKYIGERGHDPDMLHGGAESGDVVITLSTGHQMRARVTPKETTRSWRTPDGKKWIQNRELIDDFCASLAYDPLRFLDKEPKEQAEQLLKLAPIPVAPEEIAAAVSEAENEAADVTLAEGGNGLDVIQAIHDHLYSRRREYNTGADTQEKHATELEKALPPAPASGQNWTWEANTIRAKKGSLEAKERDEVADLNKTFLEKKGEAESLRADAYTAIDKDISAKIAALEKERASRKTAVDTNCAGVTESARSTGEFDIDAVRERNKPTLDALAAELATAEERARAQQQAEGTRQAAEVARQEATVKRAKSLTITEALDRLQGLKMQMVGRLKIKMGRVEGGRIVREQDGGLVPLKRWNTADQYKFALSVGMMIGQKAGFVCVDHVEAFDDENRKKLFATAQKYADEKGIQFILASVHAPGGSLSVQQPGS